MTQHILLNTREIYLHNAHVYVTVNLKRRNKIKPKEETASYTNLVFRFDKGTSAGFRVLVGTLTVDGVLATCERREMEQY